MSLPENNSTQRALRREWVAARLIVIGGLILGIAVVGYFAYQQWQAANNALKGVATQTAPRRKINAKALAEAELEVCSAELIRAKALGIVPQYGVLVSPHLIRGNIANRYVCEAGTSLTHYYIAADLLCNKLADARCVSIYRIAVKGGMLVYARPQ